MERTIDGIDYIAKSEVLRIIDVDIRAARVHLTNTKEADITAFGWTCRLRALHNLRERIANIQER